MLRPAQLYAEKLAEAQVNTWYNPKYMYYMGGTFSEASELGGDNRNTHNFVSVDKDDEVVGYISYYVNWESMSAKNLGIIGFGDANVLFAKDVYEAISNIFTVYHFNRLSWFCIADNPAIKAYRRLVKMYGGRECGYHRQATKLQDGKLHDVVDFEILACEFLQDTKGHGKSKA